MKITFSLFFILVIATKLNSKYNVHCAKDSINGSSEINYSPYTFGLSSYDLDSQNKFLINLEHGEPKQNLRKKRNENPLEHLEESNYNTEEYMTKNDANDTISHEQPEYETPHQEYETSHQEYETPHQEYETPHQEYETPHQEYETPHQEYETPHQEYPQQHSSTYEQYENSNINESSLDTKLESESHVEGELTPHVDHVGPAEDNYNTENVNANESHVEDGHAPHTNHAEDGHAPHTNHAEDGHAPHTNHVEDGHAPHINHAEDGHAPHINHAEDGHAPHVNHVDPASKVEEAWEVIAMNESKKEVNEPSYKTADINQIFIKGIDLCKDIFDFRRTKSTYKNENNSNNKVTPEEPKNDESYQITVDARDDIEPLPPVSKVYIIDNTLEQYMKDIYSILINIQNAIEKNKTVVE
ncbi:conserved Plasmodium protein, unknown function [Plasmodium vinckei]|uniref:Fam-c protein n=1 Tax=Plasmodium vinckei TaxID=5860 RepID=A0A6V7SUF2_PLAVN|nr:conserved Plasmodium protein, unknown function [Plasmodium vinckei]